MKSFLEYLNEKEMRPSDKVDQQRYREKSSAKKAIQRYSEKRKKPSHRIDPERSKKASLAHKGK